MDPSIGGPKDGKFLWGVATSGYQSEGGYNGPDEPRNNWASAEESGRVAKTGVGVDFWNRYREDLALCQNMGLDAFRLSVEWPRVQPGKKSGPSEAPAFDLNALDGYAERIAACREYGMEPVVTLQHFTHPEWLGVDAWLDDKTPELFATFVKTSVGHINRKLRDNYHQPPIHWYVTLNEPNMLVLNTYLNRHFPGGLHWGIRTGMRAYNRLLAAHVLAYNAIHDIYETNGWKPPMVTMNTFCSDIYWSENILLDLLCIKERKIKPAELPLYLAAGALSLEKALGQTKLRFRSDIYVWLGKLVRRVSNWLAPRRATTEGFAFLLNVIEQSRRDKLLDYLGLDYYDPFTSHLFRAPTFADLEFSNRSLHAKLMDGLSSKWWDWHVLPEGMHFFCKYYTERYPGLGILIAENGMAYRRKSDNSGTHERRDGVKRSEFLKASIEQIQKLRLEGVPMIGYLHWSLTDNYEWGSFSPRFGLFSIDYANGSERKAQDHLGDRPSETYAQLIRKARG